MTQGQWMKGCPEGGEQGFLFSLYQELSEGESRCPNGCSFSIKRRKSDFFAIFVSTIPSSMDQALVNCFCSPNFRRISITLRSSFRKRVLSALNPFVSHAVNPSHMKCRSKAPRKPTLNVYSIVLTFKVLFWVLALPHWKKYLLRKGNTSLLVRVTSPSLGRDVRRILYLCRIPLTKTMMMTMITILQPSRRRK